MKQRIPYFNFYPSDFMKGVRGLTAQEVGIYTMLLCRIYEENGPIDFHPGRLAAYCGCTEKVVEKVIERLVYLGRLSLTGKQLSDDRAEAEILKRENALKSQSRAGAISAEKRKQNQWQEATNVQRLFNHTDTDTDTDINNSEAKASAPMDFAKEVFGQGVRFLTANGKTEGAARAIIGKWRKDHDDEAILAAFIACNKAGAVDPVPWITAKLGRKGAGHLTAEALTAMMNEALQERRR